MRGLWYLFIAILLSDLTQGLWDWTRGVAEAQQPGSIPRIGNLWVGVPTDLLINRNHEAFRQGLRDLGYVEGRNIAFEDRYAEGYANRLPGLANDLVSRNVNVIVASATPAAQAAKNATKTIPIVFALVGEPLHSGFVESLARPGGNMTGVRLLEPELSGKRLELLKEAIPSLKRVAVLVNLANPVHTLYLKEMKLAASAFGITLQFLEVRGPDELDRAFDALTKERPDALILLPDATFASQRPRIMSFSINNRLAVMYSFSRYVEEGGLMSYGPNYPDIFRRAATYVDKILKGSSPAEIPVEGPIRFELVVNLNTAKKIDLTIPPAVLRQADRIVK
jgi:putative tryptophan/tyrosine transport system substrate-binding protein